MNLNFHLQQTHFGAFISIKKTLVKDRLGSNLQLFSLLTGLQAENHDLQDRVGHLEYFATSLKRDLEEAVINSGANSEII